MKTINLFFISLLLLGFGKAMSQNALDVEKLNGSPGLTVNALNGYTDVYGSISSHNTSNDAFWADNPANDGLEVTNAGRYGVYVVNSNQDGITVNNAGDNGVYVENSSNHGVLSSFATNDGFFSNQSGRHGIQILSAASDGIRISGSGSHGIEIASGTTGLYVRDQANQGVFSFNTGLEAGVFRNAASSNVATLYVGHLDDTKYDMQIGGHARTLSDGRYIIQLDGNNNATNDNFEILRSAAQGGDYIFWAGEQGDAWIRRNFHCFGSLSKGGGTFKIDHPLDPENQYLYHSFIESPDMMNVYNGNVVLDEKGEATVTMEDWFEELNRDFRYQLTTIGGAALVYIAEEMNDGTFKIAGGKPNMKVSWLVTGIRQDAWANENRVEVEVEKEAYNKGKYVHPEVFEKMGRGTNLEQITPQDPNESSVDVDYERETQAEILRNEEEAKLNSENNLN